MEQLVIGRVGHYHDAGNGSCSTALVVDVTEPGGDDSETTVNLAVWQHDGDSFVRLAVPATDVVEGRNTFHLTRSCPFGR